MEDPIIEEIAEDVHVGWMLEKQRQGFADHIWTACYSGVGVPTCSKIERRHHPDMLPYSELADNVKKYDRATARAVFAGLLRRGYTIVPPSPVVIPENYR